MQRFLTLSFVLALAVATAASPVPEGPAEDDAPSLVSRVFAEREPVIRVTQVSDTEPVVENAAGRVAAAEALIELLEPEERAELLLSVDDPERSKWTNVPPRMDDEGLRLGDLDEEEIGAVQDLLATALSHSGYERTRDIMLADDRLLPPGGSRPGFGAENFWLVLFGEPDAKGAWGLQLDGHHLALNLSFSGEGMTMSPTFLGAQPSRFERGDEVVEPLGDAVSGAFALIGSLDDTQRATAVVGPTRAGNVAAAGRDGFVPEREGLACSELSADQMRLAQALFTAVVRDLPQDIAQKRLRELENELPEMHLSWRGPTSPKSDVSFRLQGPTLILEYACQDLGGDPLDHLHLMYRDPTNEYGARL